MINGICRFNETHYFLFKIGILLFLSIFIIFFRYLELYNVFSAFFIRLNLQHYILLILNTKIPNRLYESHLRLQIKEQKFIHERQAQRSDFFGVIKLFILEVKILYIELCVIYFIYVCICVYKYTYTHTCTHTHTHTYIFGAVEGL